MEEPSSIDPNNYGQGFLIRLEVAENLQEDLWELQCEMWFPSFLHAADLCCVAVTVGQTWFSRVCRVVCFDRE